jgi:hypothetical protein
VILTLISILHEKKNLAEDCRCDAAESHNFHMESMFRREVEVYDEIFEFLRDWQENNQGAGI